MQAKRGIQRGRPAGATTFEAAPAKAFGAAVRAIRTEEDEAHVYCYDRRLAQTGYGQRLLQGLPPFTRVRRAAVPAF